jgi:hypothetical protein
MHRTAIRVALAAAFAAATVAAPARAAWEPTKPVEFIVPAGTGGGADQMARFLQGVVAKHNLMKQPLVVVLLGSILASGVPVLHMQGVGLVGGRIAANSSGALFWVWTNIALGASGMLSFVLSARRLWSLRRGQSR